MLKLNKINRALNDSSGFTMIEVLMSIVVLSVGLLAISLMQAYFASGNSKSREIVRATDIAMNKIEALTNISNSSDSALSSGTHIDTVDDYERPYSLNWTVVNNTNGTMAITVSVSWTETTGDHTTQHTMSFPWVKND